MKVRLLVSRSGTDGAFSVGDVIDVPADEGARMIEAGQCVPEKAKRETTMKKSAKRTGMKHGKGEAR